MELCDWRAGWVRQKERVSASGSSSRKGSVCLTGFPVMIVLAKISPHYIRKASDSCRELPRERSLKANLAAILYVHNLVKRPNWQESLRVDTNVLIWTYVFTFSWGKHKLFKKVFGLQNKPHCKFSQVTCFPFVENYCGLHVVFN